MKRRNKRSHNVIVVYLLLFAFSTITVFNLLNHCNSNEFDVESLSGEKPRYRFWTLCDSCEENGTCKDLGSCKLPRLEYSLDADREMLVKYPGLKAFSNVPRVDPVTVSTFLRTLLNGALWVFAAKGFGEPFDLIYISENADDSMQFGMVYCRPGVFDPCRHFVDHAGEPSEGQKERNSDYYVVRRVSSLSVRVSPDSEVCMPVEKSPPVVIMPGTYAAVIFNNALLHRNLFWMSIIHNLKDLGKSRLRHLSIFLQRLLWETDHQLILFRHPSSHGRPNLISNHSEENTQCRVNIHYDWDAIEDFAVTLSNMRCKHERSTFLECAFELIDMIFSRYNSEFEELKQILILWFKSLDYIGYNFPKRVPFIKNKLLQKKWGLPAVFSPPKSKPYFPFHACTPTDFMNENVKEEQKRQNVDDTDLSMYDNEVVRLKERRSLREINTVPNGENETTDILDLLNTEKIKEVENEFTSLCRSVNTEYRPVMPERFKFDDILLIVVFNYPYLVSHIPKLLTMYGRHFQHILFCGEKVHSFDKLYSAEHSVRVSFVQVNHQQGHWAYSCTSAAIKMGYSTSGFLQISDDMLLNVWNLKGLPLDKPWFQPRVRVADVRMRRLPDIATTSRWYPWIFGAGRLASRLVFNSLKQLARNGSIKSKVRSFMKQLKQTSGCGDCLMYEASDIFYVPSWMKEDYVLFADLFHLHRLHLELAVPTILFGLTEEHHVVRLRGNYLWGEGPRAQFLKFYSPHDHFQHAWKLTRLVDQSSDGGGGLRFFCRVFLPKVDGDLKGAIERDNRHDRQGR